ncbi:MAG: ExbD/TolR family protein [Phycisphaeraceae bacterium JB051]
MIQLTDQHQLQRPVQARRTMICRRGGWSMRVSMVGLLALSLGLLGGCACSQSCSVAKPQQTVSQPGTTVINLDANGQISCQGKTYTANQVDALMSQLAQQDAGQTLVIKADPNTPFSDAIALMDAARKAGLTQISVATSNTNNSEL